MTPLNIALGAAVLALIALLLKLRRDRSARDADFDDRPIGSWAAPAATSAHDTEAPSPAAASGGAHPQTGSSWVVGGGGMDAGGWPGRQVTDPGWPRPGQMSAAWPAAAPAPGAGSVPPGIMPLGAAPRDPLQEWDGPMPAAGAADWLAGDAPESESVRDTVPQHPHGATEMAPAAEAAARATAAPDDPAVADEVAAGLPVWTPSAAPRVPEPAPALAADADQPDAWPVWQPAAGVQDAPPATDQDTESPAPTPWDDEPTPSTPWDDEPTPSTPWDDEPTPSTPWGDDAGLAVAEHAATVDAGDPVIAATPGPFTELAAYPGLAVAPGDRLEAGRGRFALGGHAMRAGQQAVSGVSFRSSVGVPPPAWNVAPAPGVAPGTLVLHLEGAVNCGVDGLQVVMDEGFAPTEEGFTVRIAARGPGPFIASGTFEIAG